MAEINLEKRLEKLESQIKEDISGIEDKKCDLQKILDNVHKWVRVGEGIVADLPKAYEAKEISDSEFDGLLRGTASVVIDGENAILSRCACKLK